MAQQPLVGQGFFIIEAPRSYLVRHTTLGRTSLDEWSARSWDIHTNLYRQISLTLVGFEPAIRASEPSQTHPLDRPVTGIAS